MKGEVWRERCVVVEGKVWREVWRERCVVVEGEVCGGGGDRFLLVGFLSVH